VNLEMGDEPCGLRPASVSRRTEGLAWTCNCKAAVPDMMITVPMENRWRLGRRAGVAITEAGQGHLTKPQQSGTRLRHSASRGHTRTSFLSFRGTRRIRGCPRARTAGGSGLSVRRARRPPSPDLSKLCLNFERRRERTASNVQRTASNERSTPDGNVNRRGVYRTWYRTRPTSNATVRRYLGTGHSVAGTSE
jgi:hypothetical protein